MSRTFSSLYTGGVSLSAGDNPATVTGAGTIVNATNANDGAAIYGASTPWTVVNYGTVGSTYPGGTGIALLAGGLVANRATVAGNSEGVAIFGAAASATVTNTGAITAGYDGVALTAATDLLVNSGLISGSRATSYGAYLAGGTVTNSATGIIRGYEDGLNVGKAAATVVNLGLIAGTGTIGTGVSLIAGGTLTNAGTIAGGHMAVNMLGVGNRLIVDPGAVFGGGVYGGDAGGVLELASGSSAGTLAGFGTAFTGFATLTVDGGAQWVLAGTNTIGGVTVTDAGGLTNTGTLAAGAVTLTGAGYFHNAATAVVNAGGIGVSVAVGNTANNTVINAGTISGGGAGVGEAIAAFGTGAIYISNGGLLIGHVNTGVYARGIGTIVNDGTIIGAGGFAGVFLASGGTVVDAGTISGGAGTAVFFGGVSSNLLVLDAGYSVGGQKIVGSTAAGATNTLELGSTASVGTITALANFANFTSFAVNSGAQWQIVGANTIASGVTLVDSGRLTNVGTLAVGGALVVDPGTLVNSGLIPATVTLAGAGLLENTATGTIAVGGAYGVNGTNGPNTVVNAGLITANLADIVLSGGGIVSNSGTLIGGATDNAVNAVLSAGTVINSGTIQDFGGVGLQFGGIVTNAAAGIISATGADGIAMTSAGGYVDNAGRIIANANAVYVQSGSGTVVNSGTLVGTGIGADGIRLNLGGTVTNAAAAALVAGYTDGVEIDAGTGTVINSGTLAGTGNNGRGVSLTSGGLTNSAGGVIAGAQYAVFLGGADVAVNAGTLSGGGDGLRMIGGGTIGNSGRIAGGNYGLFLDDGGNVTNTGSIGGKTGIDDGTGPGLLSNSGGVTGTAGSAAYMYFGGTVINTGTLAGEGTNGVGISMHNGGGIIDNAAGAIYGGHYGVSLGSNGGTVTNAGTIVGVIDGVIMHASVELVVNSGVIANSNATAGAAVYLIGGNVTNVATGVIAGSGEGIRIAQAAGTVVNLGVIKGTGTAGVGVALLAGGTLVDAGTIVGSGGYAVSVEGGRLVVDPGAAFVGAIDGDASSGNTVEFAAGGVAGTINGTGFFDNFAGANLIAVDPSAAWVVNGTPNFAAGMTISDSGTLTFTDVVGNAGIMEIAAGATLALDGTVGGAGALAFAGGGASLVLGGTAMPANTISGFAPGDRIDLAGLPFSATVRASYNSTGHTLIVGGGSNFETLTVAGIPADTGFVVTSDGQGGTVIEATSMYIISGPHLSGIVLQNATPQNPATVAAGGYVTNQTTAFGGDAIVGLAPTPWTLTNYGSINGTAGVGVLFNNGGAVFNEANITTGPSAFNTIEINSATAYVGNAGLILNTDTAFGNAVRFAYGATGGVGNIGTIAATGGTTSTAIFLQNGGSVDNASTTALIASTNIAVSITSGTATVTNAGTIAGGTGTNASGISLNVSALVTNTGTITGGANAIGDFGTGTVATVVNSGVILGSETIISSPTLFSFGVILQTGTVDNTGTIASLAQSNGTGVQLNVGGFVSNASTGLISGSSEGVALSGTVASTLVNFGVITATGTSGSAVNVFPGTVAGDIVNHGTIAQIGAGTLGNAVVLNSGGALENYGLITDGELSVAAVGINNAAGTVANSGTIADTGQSNGISFNLGGTLTNSGTVTAVGTNSSAVGFNATGGLIVNGTLGQTVGLISGYHLGIGFFPPSTIANPGILTILNYGVIQSTQQNIVSGTLGGQAINAGSNTALVVYNFGTIRNSQTQDVAGSTTGIATALLINKGVVINEAGAVIDGDDGHSIASGATTGAGVTIENFGTLTSSDPNRSNVYIGHDGGTIINSGAAALIVGPHGVNFGPTGGGAGFLVNSGDILQTSTLGGSGVYFGQGGTLTNQAGGLISAALDAVDSEFSPVAIDNYGTIVSTATRSNAVFIGGGGNVTNGATNATGALITALWVGVDFKTVAGTVTNFGTIASTATFELPGTVSGGSATVSGTGILLQNGGLLVNGAAGSAGALIAGYVKAVYIGGASGIQNAGAVGTVVNYGTIASIGAGVNAGPALQLTAGGTIVNRGLVASAASNAVDIVDAPATVANYGFIENFTAAHVAIYSRAGGLITNASGAVISSPKSAIAFGNTINATPSFGTVVNSGEIESTGTANAGIYFAQGGYLNNKSGGLVSAYRDAVSVKGTLGTIVNAGAIVSNGTYFDAAYLGAGGAITNATGGLIVTPWDAVNTNNVAATVVNFGTIASSFEFLNGGTLRASGVHLSQGGLIVNGTGESSNGLITGYEFGIGIGTNKGVPQAGAVGTVINYATISSTGTGSNSAPAIRLSAGGTIVNSGFIESLGNNAVDLFGTVPGTVVNSGLIESLSSAHAAIYSSAGGVISNTGAIVASNVGVALTADATLINDGTISGASGSSVSLGTADEFVIESGSVLQGVITNVHPSDSFDLAFLPFATGATATLGANNELSVADSNGSFNLYLDPAQNLAAYRFIPVQDSTGDTIVHVQNIGTVITGTHVNGIALTNAGQNPVTIAQGGYVGIDGDYDRALYGESVYAWTVTNYGTVNGAGSDSTGIGLQDGGTVTNGSPSITSALVEGTRNGVAIEGAPGAVVNFGTIVSTSPAGGIGVGVHIAHGGPLTNGAAGSTAALITAYRTAVYIGGNQNSLYAADTGTVTNYGTIASTGADYTAIALAAGGTLFNASSGIVSADGDGLFIGSTVGNVDNQGTIASTAAVGIDLAAGGSLINEVGGLVEGDEGGVYVFGSAGNVDNAGTIASAADDAVYLGDGGYVVNRESIVGALDGVDIRNIGTVNNSGIIIGGGSGDFGGIFLEGDYSFLVTNTGTIESTAGGVLVAAAGTINNASGALIVGGYVGAKLSEAGIVINSGTIAATDGTGVVLYGSATLINAGIIAGSDGAAAVNLYGNYNRLIVDPGATFYGAIQGGFESHDVLELAPNGEVNGSIGVLGVNINGFPQVIVDASATWQLTGASALAAGYTLTDAGTLTFTGAVSNYGTLVIDAGASLELAAGASGSGDIAFNAAGGVLQIDGNVMPTNTITNFGFGDEIDLRGLVFDSTVSATFNAATGIISVTSGGVQVDQLTASGLPAGAQVAASSDSFGETLLTPTAGGGTNLIVNGGFEESSSHTTTPPGWTNIGHTEGVIAYTDFNTPVFQGLEYYDIGGFGEANPPRGDGLEQTVATTPGTTYTLTFGLTGENAAGTEILQVAIGSQISDFTLVTNPSFAAFTVPFATESVSYTATGAATTVAFTLAAASPSTGNEDPLIDGVSFAATGVTAQANLFDFVFTYNDSGDFYEGVVADNGSFGYSVGQTFQMGNGTYTIFNNDGTTADASGTVFVTDYSHDGPGIASTTPVDTAQGQPDGTGGLGSESDAVFGTDGLHHAFNDSTPASFPTTALFGFEFSYADGGDFYTGTVADNGSFGTGAGTRTVTNSAGQVVGTYTIFADGITTQAAGTVNVSRFFLDGSPFIPLITAAGGADGTSGLGSEVDAITVNGVTAAFNDQAPPAVSLSFPTVNIAPAPPPQTVFQSEVQDIFENVLDRSPSASEMTTFSNDLAGGASAAAITQALASTPEAQNDLNQLFLQVFGQNIDPTDDATDTNLLANGSSLTDLDAILGQSPQAQAAIQSLFQEVLNRSADGVGLTSAMAALSDGGNLAGVQSTLAHSAEAAGDLSIVFQKAEFRGPGPDTAELAGMEDQLSVAGATQSSIVPGQGFTTVIPVAGDGALTAQPLTPTLFDFSSVGFGHDTIGGFDTSRDTIQLSTALVGSFSAVQGDTSNANGSALITFSASQSILLNGVAPGNLTAGNFHFVSPGG